MSKELYRRLSKAERKLENTNRLRTNNATLRIKYESIKKLLEKKDKEIERLNENNQAMQEELCKVWGERDNLYRRILEAIDNLETPYFRDCEQQCKDIINILKGDDKK